MQKIFALDKYKFYLYDTTVSVLYSDEKVKNEIVNDLIKSSFLIIDSKMINSNILVSEFLKLNEFNMKLVPYFKLNDLMSKKFNKLDIETQVYLKTIVLITVIKFNLVFDDVLTFLDDEQKYLVLKYLKDNQISYINFTSNIEETLYTKYLIIINKNGVIIEGGTKSVLNEEKIIKKNGFSLPFVVDLSTQLKAYGNVDKVYYDLDKLVIDLWK